MSAASSPQAVDVTMASNQVLPTYRQISPTTHRRVKRKTISAQAQYSAGLESDTASTSSAGPSTFIPLATRRESASLQRRQSGSFSVRDENGQYSTATRDGHKPTKERRALPRPPPLRPSSPWNKADSPTSSGYSSAIASSSSPLPAIASVNNHIAGNWKMRASWGRLQMRDSKSIAGSPRNSVYSIASTASPHHTVNAFKMQAQWRQKLVNTPSPKSPRPLPNPGVPVESIPPVPALPTNAETPQGTDAREPTAILTRRLPSLPSSEKEESTPSPASSAPSKDDSIASADNALPTPVASDAQYVTITNSSPQTSVSTLPRSAGAAHGFGLDLLEFPQPPEEIPVSPAGATFDFDSWKRKGMREKGLKTVLVDQVQDANVGESDTEIHESFPANGSVSTENLNRRSRSLDYKRMREARKRRSKEKSRKSRSVTSLLVEDAERPSTPQEIPPVPIAGPTSATLKRRREPPSPLNLSQATTHSRAADNVIEITPKLSDMPSKNISQATLGTPLSSEPAVITYVRQRRDWQSGQVSGNMPAPESKTPVTPEEPESDEDDTVGVSFMLSVAQAHARMQAELLGKVPRHPPVIRPNVLATPTPKNHDIRLPSSPRQAVIPVPSVAVDEPPSSDGWSTPTEGFMTPMARSNTNLPMSSRPFADVPLSVYDSTSPTVSRVNVGPTLAVDSTSTPSVYEFTTPVGSTVHVRESVTSTIESDTSYQPDSSRDSHASFTEVTSRDSGASYDSTPGATPDNSSTDPETEGEVKDQFDEEGYNNPWLRDRPLPDVPLPESSASSIYTAESLTTASLATTDSARQTLRSRFNNSRSRLSLGLRSAAQSLKSAKGPKPPKIVVPELPKNRWFSGRSRKKSSRSGGERASVESEPSPFNPDALAPIQKATSSLEIAPNLTAETGSVVIRDPSLAMVMARPPPRTTSLLASRKKPPRTTLLRSTFRSAMKPEPPRLAITDVGYNEAFTEHGQLTEYALGEAAKLEVIAETGHRVPFGALFMGQRTIVVFIRHFWCPLCQDYMYSISKEVDPIMLGRANVQLVVISNGSYKMIKAYRKIFRTPFALFTDPSLQLYHALGMILSTTDGGPEDEKGEYVKHGVVSGVAMVVSNAAKARMPIWANGGDIEQLGGEFVLGPGTAISFVHRMKNTRSHAPIADVCLAAGVDIRTTRALNGGRSSFVAIFKNDEDARWRGAQRRSLERLHAEQEQAVYDQEDDHPADFGASAIRETTENLENNVKHVRQAITKLDNIVQEEIARRRGGSAANRSVPPPVEEDDVIYDINGSTPAQVIDDGDKISLQPNRPSGASNPPPFIRRKKNVNPPTAFNTHRRDVGSPDTSDMEGERSRRSEEPSSRNGSFSSTMSKGAMYRDLKNPFPHADSTATGNGHLKPSGVEKNSGGSDDDSSMVLRLVNGSWKKVRADAGDDDDLSSDDGEIHRSAHQEIDP